MLGNGRVLDKPIDGKPWTLGRFFKGMGGGNKMMRTVLGIYVPESTVSKTRSLLYFNNFM